MPSLTDHTIPIMPCLQLTFSSEQLNSMKEILKLPTNDFCFFFYFSLWEAPYSLLNKSIYTHFCAFSKGQDRDNFFRLFQLNIFLVPSASVLVLFEAGNRVVSCVVLVHNILFPTLCAQIGKKNKTTLKDACTMYTISKVGYFFEQCFL